MNADRLEYGPRWTLRFVLAALGFLFLAAIEGMMMRVQHVEPRFVSAEHFYAVMTAHPIVGIYGFAYMAVMGAFYFLVPYVLNTEVYSRRLIPVNFWLQSAGVLVCWSASFFTHFDSLYTLYWPLPVWFSRMSATGAAIFSAGLVLIEINVLLFSYNLFATMIKRRPAQPDAAHQPYRFRSYLAAAFGLDRIFKPRGPAAQQEPHRLYDRLPVFAVAVARGSIDTVINAVVLLGAGLLILVYSLPPLLGLAALDPHRVDALVYKNAFWWGLDMIADGNVLMYVAGSWYLLVPLLVNRKLYGEALVRTVILADLLISLFVWSHHLMADQPQPLPLRLGSGQFITWGEILTMGLTLFATMMTIYLARPVVFTPALKFVVASMYGFMLGAIAGIMQANYGLAVVLHNTQWVIGTHAHTMLLLGLSPLIFAVVYALIPMLTQREIKSPLLVNLHLVFWIGGGLAMTLAMGWAGLDGMLRRTFYPGGEYFPQMLVALLGGASMILGAGCLVLNLVQTLGLGAIARVILPAPREMPAPALTQAAAQQRG